MARASYTLDHLDELEAEGIHILREVAAQLERPAILFSGGKDSVVVVHLARKAFWPARIPMPLLHVATGHDFPETLAFRDALVQREGLRLVVGSVQATIDAGRAKDEKGPFASRNAIQSITLLETIEAEGFDACVGGARRDEEKARAKERVFSHRDEYGQWDPKQQRPELWGLYNGKKQPGEGFRVFPLSNWTELDVWQYVQREALSLPSLYFAHEREVFERQGVLMAVSEHLRPPEGTTTAVRRVRFRTVGDATCTGAVASEAGDVGAVIEEIMASRITERGGRADDLRSETAMEDRKRQGYF
jgi:sulfate adenylyltransferase subunit 2